MSAGRDVERFPGTPDQVSAARTFVRGVLREHPHRDDAVLLTSEAAANTIQHTATGQRPGGDIGAFTVAVVHDKSWVYVQVVDEGSSTVPCACSADLDSENGRGVTLISELAWQWGYTSQRLDDGDHGTVWFALGQPPEATVRTTAHWSYGRRDPRAERGYRPAHQRQLIPPQR